MIDAPKATRGPAICGMIFVLCAVVVTAFFTSHQMSAARGTARDAGPLALAVCGLGVLLGVGGLSFAFTQRANSNRRLAVICYGFGTALLLYWFVSLSSGA
jgi:protein-S-isoprenylcysteine O-methyltransferase Ste14